ncbi:MAG: Cu(I)-responsive transcriptional regulator [Burkholderiaceae bacterium]
MNIGQAAAASGVSAKMIRYYEEIGLVPAARRTDAGYRQYDATAVRTLRFIRRARELGFPIERIRMLLALWQDRSRHSADVKALAGRHIADLDRDIEKLQSIRDELRRLADCCHGDDRPECPIIDEFART